MVETITLPHKWKPRPYQLRFLRAWDNGIKRFILVWHRRSGKDKTVFPQIPKKMFQRVGLYLYFLPKYTQAKKVIWNGADKDGFRLLGHIPEEIVKNKNETEMKIELVNGSILQMVGADNIDSLMGSNPLGVIFSEYSLMKSDVWNFIRPILVENDGWAGFIFTPRGMNHAWKLLQQAKESAEWFWEVLTADDTGIISKEKLEEEKRQMPIDFFMQEYFCKFIEGASSVFKGWRICLGGALRKADFGHEYICGVDLARTQDRTVIVVIDKHDNQLVYFESIEQMPWSQQKMRITQVIKSYNNAYTVMDGTGVGDSFVDQMYMAELPVESYKISSNQVKRELIERTVMYLTNKYITMPLIPLLEVELDSFEYQITASGNITYGAPEGMHDDAVLALALCLTRVNSFKTPWRSPTEYEIAINEGFGVDDRTGYLR